MTTPFGKDEPSMNGNKIGRYIIINKIGEGRLGEVFHAQDEETKEYFAIRKFIKDSTQDKSIVQRLSEDFNRLEELAHDNIVKVQSLIHQEGHYYYIMKYVGGLPLNDFIYYNKSLNWKSSVGFVINILSALEYAKKTKVMHLGLKPKKIMITDGLYLKVRDFGMVNIFRASKRINWELNNDDLQYISPEQIRNGVGDDKSDIYSTAAILYHALCGHPPFSAYDNPEKIKEAHLKQQPPILTINVPPKLKDLVMRGLAKNPKRRFDSARQFMDELNKLLLDLDDTLYIHPASLGPKVNLDEPQKKKITLGNKTHGLFWMVIALLVFSVWKIFHPADDRFIEPELVPLKKACFVMGSPKNEAKRYPDEARHNVCVKDFKIGKYEVTFGEYDLFARATGKPLPKDDGYGRSRYPVSRVSWVDAYDYAAWLSGKTGKHYRLPTEAEWEYAARAGSLSANFSANNFQQACLFMNHRDCPNSPKHSTPVGTYKPNPWGLYDMLGNVAELTGSAYEADYHGGESRGVGLKNKGIRVMRGGSWGHVSSSLRFASRDKAKVDVTHNLLGFRLAQD